MGSRSHRNRKLLVVPEGGTETEIYLQCTQSLLVDETGLPPLQKQTENSVKCENTSVHGTEININETQI
jgi:hypothetical protein